MALNKSGGDAQGLTFFLDVCSRVDLEQSRPVCEDVFSCPEKGEKCTVVRFGFIWQIVSNR
jgi:hypothetical protein